MDLEKDLESGTSGAREDYIKETHVVHQSQIKTPKEKQQHQKPQDSSFLKLSAVCLWMTMSLVCDCQFNLIYTIGMFRP